MKINLVDNGIFPVVVDHNNNALHGELDTGLRIPGTVQGEGKLLGTSVIFIRTSGCNLKCSWVGADGLGSLCDTPYSSHKPEKNMTPVDDIVQTIINNSKIANIKHIVISGGEPTIQTEALKDLVRKLRDNGYHITIETNATIHDKELSAMTDLMSMSPKLSSSTPWESHLVGTNVEYNERRALHHDKIRINTNAIIKNIEVAVGAGNDYQLKFVVSDQRDMDEILDIYNNVKKHFESIEKGYYITPDDVVLMPEGITEHDLRQRYNVCLKNALLYGFRFTPRLHVTLFGLKRGV